MKLTSMSGLHGSPLGGGIPQSSTPGIEGTRSKARILGNSSDSGTSSSSEGVDDVAGAVTIAGLGGLGPGCIIETCVLAVEPLATVTVSCSGERRRALWFTGLRVIDRGLFEEDLTDELSEWYM